MKHGSRTIMLWGCVAASGAGNIARVEGRMDSTEEQQILEVKVRLYAKKPKLKRGWLQLQDDPDDPKQIVFKSTMDHLKRCKLKVLEWSSQFPDFNYCTCYKNVFILFFFSPNDDMKSNYAEILYFMFLSWRISLLCMFSPRDSQTLAYSQYDRLFSVFLIWKWIIYNLQKCHNRLQISTFHSVLSVEMQVEQRKTFPLRKLMRKFVVINNTPVALNHKTTDKWRTIYQGVWYIRPQVNCRHVGSRKWARVKIWVTLPRAKLWWLYDWIRATA